MDEKRVAIVGAGISGLLACKYAAAKGFTPVVLEEQDKVGGLWNHTLESTTLQVPKQLYEFSDFPWPSSVQELLPHNTQLTEYLQSYAHKFQLLHYVKFKSKVIDVDYVGESEDEMNCWGGDRKAFGSKGKWILRLSHAGDDSIKVSKYTLFRSQTHISMIFSVFSKAVTVLFFRHSSKGRILMEYELHLYIACTFFFNFPMWDGLNFNVINI